MACIICHGQEDIPVVFRIGCLPSAIHMRQLLNRNDYSILFIGFRKEYWVGHKYERV